MSLAFAAVLTISAGQAPTAAPVFTAAQAAAGQASYQANCASCHLPDLAGQNEAPPLAGANFMTTWRARTARDLIDYMQATMPPGRPSLAETDYVNIAAFILRSNGAAAGSELLRASSADPIGSVATGQRAAAVPPRRRWRRRRSRPRPCRSAALARPFGDTAKCRITFRSPMRC